MTTARCPVLPAAACLPVTVAVQESEGPEGGDPRFQRNPPVDQDIREAEENRPEDFEPVVKSGSDFILWGDLMVRGATRMATLDPQNPKRSFHFAALEGPEVGTYYRGSCKETA